jgi:hypothetical protein
MFVTDDEQRPTSWMVLHAPIQSSSRREMFAVYRRRGLGFIGMTSFMTFPRADPNDSLACDDPLAYEDVCEGWCHCFRDPDRYLPPSRPRALLSLSDFTDSLRIDRHALGSDASDAARFDFVYVGAAEPWKAQAKNWTLARECLSVLCSRMHLRGLAIGIPMSPGMRIEGLTVWPWLPYVRFLQVLSRSRFLFAPYAQDASPRVLAEALCLDVPLLVHREILGGWKYVTPTTGVFFEGADDVEEHARQCLNGVFAARAWYARHFGPARAGQALAIHPPDRSDLQGANRALDAGASMRPARAELMLTTSRGEPLMGEQ